MRSGLSCTWHLSACMNWRMEFPRDLAQKAQIHVATLQFGTAEQPCGIMILPRQCWVRAATFRRLSVPISVLRLRNRSVDADLKDNLFVKPIAAHLSPQSTAEVSSVPVDPSGFPLKHGCHLRRVEASFLRSKSLCSPFVVTCLLRACNRPEGADVEASFFEEYARLSLRIPVNRSSRDLGRWSIWIPPGVSPLTLRQERWFNKSVQSDQPLGGLEVSCIMSALADAEN